MEVKMSFDDLSYWHLIILIIIGICAILAYIKGFFGWLIAIVKKMSANGGHAYSIPKRTITLAPSRQSNSTWWHMGRSGNDPAMQISGRFTVTNISTYNLLLVAAIMKKQKGMGHVMTRKMDENIYGDYMIPGGGVTELSYHFWIIPPFKPEGESFVADIAIVDQFNNKHWVNGVEFPYS